MTDAMMIVARPLAETEAIATATTVKTIPVSAARIRSLVVAGIVIAMRADRQL